MNISIALENGFRCLIAFEHLVGDRRSDAYAEKLRQSVEVIQEYNAGRKLVKQCCINTSVLMSLAGVWSLPYRNLS